MTFYRVNKLNIDWINKSIDLCDGSLTLIFYTQINNTYVLVYGITVKILKFGTPQTITIIVLKNRKVWCNIALMHPKDADGMANSVDPDQTAS